MATPPILFLFKTIQQAIRTELDRTLRGTGLSLPQVAVLSHLERHPGASNAELARATFVTPQSMGEIIASLEAGRLVERRPDPDHSRILRAMPTSKGSMALGKARDAFQQVEQRMLAGLNADDTQRLRELLEHCASALRAEPT